MTPDPITLEDPTGDFLRRLYVPLWCIIWIEIVLLGTYWITTNIPEIPLYSYMHFRDPLFIPRLATTINTLLITLVCVTHRYIEEWVIRAAPHMQALVQQIGEYEEEDDGGEED